MVPGSSPTLLAIAATLLTAAPAGAAPAPGIADFLTAIGGDTELKTSGSELSDPSSQLYPLAGRRRDHRLSLLCRKAVRQRLCDG